ncbi:MAG: hypothetical protein RLZZ143_2602 [Cyanobacteriota bacterium]|jgi:hypothetical protein
MGIYFPIITDNSYLNGQVGVDRRYRISLYFIFMRKALYRSVWGNGSYTFQSN